MKSSSYPHFTDESCHACSRWLRIEKDRSIYYKEMWRKVGVEVEFSAECTGRKEICLGCHIAHRVMTMVYIVRILFFCAKGKYMSGRDAHDEMLKSLSGWIMSVTERYVKDYYDNSIPFLKDE